MSTIVAPSLLSADFGDLRKDLEMINRSQADWLHLDIMDGVFVPNISFGFPVLKYVAKYCTKPLDLHLMIVEPEKFMDRFQELGVATYNVHYEACTHLNRTIFEIKNRGMKAAVTLNPSTPVSMLTDVIRDVDMVLLMTVNPGFGGQKFMDSSLPKIAYYRKKREELGLDYVISVDGGVGSANAYLVRDAGVDLIVAGSAVFKAADRTAEIAAIKG